MVKFSILKASKVELMLIVLQVPSLLEAFVCVLSAANRLHLTVSQALQAMAMACGWVLQGVLVLPSSCKSLQRQLLSPR